MLTGGPGTGKSSVLKELSNRGFTCLDEVSREVTLKAKKEGIDQLFLEKPLLFSELLLQGRIQQFNDAKNITEPLVFLDRGIPDIEAYLLYANKEFPKIFSEECKNYLYDSVFFFMPWKEIYKIDNERYESFEESEKISKHLFETYSKYNYKLIAVPFGTIKERVDFILKKIQNDT